MRRRATDRATRSRFARAARHTAGAIALASLVLACGGDETGTADPGASLTQPAPTAPAPADPAPAAEMPAADESAGEAIALDGVVPDGYPSDVPLYPGATPGASMAMPGLGVFATFLSDDSVEKVLTHYRNELSKGGWNVADSADGTGVDGTKGTRSVQVRARADEEGRTEIAVNTAEK